MKSIKKRIAVVCSAVFMLLNSTFLTANASTTNINIQGFGVQPSTGSWSTLKSSALKETDSSVYLYLTSAAYPTYVKVLQGNANVTRNGSNDDVSYVTCSQGIEYRIRNSASVPSFITLSFLSSNQYSGYAISGWWSPDWVSEANHSYQFAY